MAVISTKSSLKIYKTRFPPLEKPREKKSRAKDENSDQA